jgi:ferredoxin-NADP reductase
MAKSNELMLKVAAKVKLTHDIVGLTLVSVAGEALPQWRPGSHIDLTLNAAADNEDDFANEK